MKIPLTKATKVGGQVTLIGCVLALSGCSADLNAFIDRELGHLNDAKFHASVVVSPSQSIGGAATKGVADLTAAKKAGDACTLYGHSVRSKPGYSTRSLAREFLACVLRHGAAQVSCDVVIGPLTAAPDDVAVEIPVVYKVSSIGDAAPAVTSSWVAEAAWRAIQREGSLVISVPARSRTGLDWQFARLKSPGDEPLAGDWRNAGDVLSMQAIRSLALAEVATALAGHIQPAIWGLVAEDGLTRFMDRKAAYGIGLCAVEAAPQEDGIDTLAVLSAAQRLRDGKFLHDHFADASAAEREEVVALARKVCGMMTPKTWRSNQRERLDARPVFISKTSVVLELPPKATRLSVSRNAFTDEGEELLGRMEYVMVELVAKLNASALRASGVSAAEAEAQWRRIVPNANE